MRKLYIIRDSKNHTEYFSYTNKREAEGDLNIVNRVEAEVCTPNGMIKPFELIELDEIYITVDTSSTEDYLIQSFDNLKEARQYAQKHFLTLGRKCIKNEDFVDFLHTACGIAYEELECYEENC